LAGLDRALRERVVPAEVFCELALALQVLCGIDVKFAKLLGGKLARALIQYEDASVGRQCVERAAEICVQALGSEEISLLPLVRSLVEVADTDRLGPSSRAITMAAAARGIPVRRLPKGSLVQLGEGKHQQRIWTAENEATSEIAVCIAQDKQLTRRMLSAVGVPVPKGKRVTSADEAWAAACQIGLPVVVKPSDGNHGRGISLYLTTEDEVRAAYDFAVLEAGDSDKVLVEQFINGNQHRALVVDGQIVAIARGESDYVVGDGRRTINELIDEANRDPRRGPNYTDVLSVIYLNGTTLQHLQQQHLTIESVPAAGRKVLLSRVGDLTIDCTDDVHPAAAATLSLAARTVGLNIAGIDFIAQDISRPLEAQGAAIVEVNSSPSLGMHLAPLVGRPRPVGEAILNTMYSGEANGRIPIIAVAGVGERASIAKRIAGLLRENRWAVGLATSPASFAPVEPGEFTPVERLVMHPDHEAAVFEACPHRASRYGFEYPRCDVLVIAGDEDLDEQHALALEIALRALPDAGCLVLDGRLEDRYVHHGGRRIIVGHSQSHLGPTSDSLRISNGRLNFIRRGEHISAALPGEWQQADLQQRLLALAACWAIEPNIERVLALLPEQVTASPQLRIASA
jgi:cyanophycin synthetase